MMQRIYEFLTFSYSISPGLLVAFYILGAVGMPYFAWRLAHRFLPRPAAKPPKAGLAGAPKSGRWDTGRLYSVCLLAFIFMEVLWRMLFEYLAAFLQMRDALLVISGL